jgi:Tfp pilus assembly protein PilW
MKRQRGFTLMELLAAIGSLLSISILILVIVVVWHFIAKYW